MLIPIAKFMEESLQSTLSLEEIKALVRKMKNVYGPRERFWEAATMLIKAMFKDTPECERTRDEWKQLQGKWKIREELIITLGDRKLRVDHLREECHQLREECHQLREERNQLREERDQLQKVSNQRQSEKAQLIRVIIPQEARKRGWNTAQEVVKRFAATLQVTVTKEDVMMTFAFVDWGLTAWWCRCAEVGRSDGQDVLLVHLIFASIYGYDHRHLYVYL